jgi:hypothetical protein
MAKKLKMIKKRKNGRGGSRLGAGRKGKPDKDAWGYVTCSLKKDTIKRLREGADSIYIGEFLQKHLDRYPVPTRAEFLALETLEERPDPSLYVDPLGVAGDPATRAAARAEARAARRARHLAALMPAERKAVKEVIQKVKPRK